MQKPLILTHTRILKALFIIAIAISTMYSIYKNGFSFEPIFFLNTIIRPITLVILVFISSDPKETSSSMSAFFGAILSFSGVFFLNAFPINYSKEILWVYQSTVFFYTIFLIWSLISIGKNFGFLPALRSISTNGTYQIVRHPIYSSYIHIILSCLAIFPNFKNLIASILTIFGLYLRMIAEEKILSVNLEYLKLKKRTGARIFQPVLTLPLIILFSLIPFSRWASTDSVKTFQLVTISSSTIQSLNPAEYDEWGAVFIGNHIYPRLLPDETSQRSFSIGKITSRQCLPNEKLCTAIKFTFKIEEVEACNGAKLNADIVKNELVMILQKKNWILDHWALCNTIEPDEICLQTNNSPDIERKFRTIYFRFGHSLSKNDDKIIGIGPYCLLPQKYEDKKISEALLEPKSKDLPKIFFSNNYELHKNFDLALYGMDSLLTSEKRKISTHTPMGIFTISNPKFNAPNELPWTTVEARSIIADHLKRYGLISETTSSLKAIIPSGAAASLGSIRHFRNSLKSLEFVIPDYFNDCSVLAESLQNLWKNKFPNINAVCKDLSIFIPQEVFTSEPHWDGFIIPLTPGGYFRMALQNQYFSAESNESWIKGTRNAEQFFYLLGISPTYVVTSKRICSIRPNPVGLSDLSVNDLIYCN